MQEIEEEAVVISPDGIANWSETPSFVSLHKAEKNYLENAEKKLLEIIRSTQQRSTWHLWIARKIPSGFLYSWMWWESRMLSCPIIGGNRIKQNSMFTIECSKLSISICNSNCRQLHTGSKSNNNNMKNKLQSDKQKKIKWNEIKTYYNCTTCSVYILSFVLWSKVKYLTPYCLYLLCELPSRRRTRLEMTPSNTSSNVWYPRGYWMTVNKLKQGGCDVVHTGS